MPEQTSNHARLRILAIAALVAFAMLLLIVVATSGGGDDTADGGSQAGRTAGQTETGGGGGERRRPRRRRATYTIRPGDSLGVIAERTGVSVERLQELNPDVDPQALDAGTRLRLR